MYPELFYIKSKIQPYKLQLSLELFGCSWVQVHINVSKIKQLLMTYFLRHFNLRLLNTFHICYWILTCHVEVITGEVSIILHSKVLNLFPNCCFEDYIGS